jgi:hypothetical protein
LLESCFTPNEDHDGGNDEKQDEAGQKASKDMNLIATEEGFTDRLLLLLG